MGLLKRVFCLIYSMISTAFLERNLFLYLGFNIQLVSFYMLYFRFFVFRIPTVFQKKTLGVIHSFTALYLISCVCLMTFLMNLFACW